MTGQAEFRWVDRGVLLWMHEQTLAEHGGLNGLRDKGLLESALARPQHILAYNNDASLAELTAAYSFGIARNHPFNDGNKRAALIVIGLFLAMHDYRLAVSQVEAVQAMLTLASGDMNEEQLAAWINAHLQQRR